MTTPRPSSPTENVLGPVAQDIDWANFVYAYARGRWDPIKPPKPPGRSTALPGAATRIVLPGASQPSKEGSFMDPNPSAITAARRPSLGYEELGLGKVPPLHPAPSSGPSGATMPSIHSTLEKGSAANLLPSPPAATLLSSSLFRDGHSGIVTPTDSDCGSSSAFKPSESLTGADLAAIQFSTASSPELNEAVNHAAQAEAMGASYMASHVEKMARATKSNSEAIPSVQKNTNRWNQGRREDHSVWAGKQREQPAVPELTDVSKESAGGNTVGRKAHSDTGIEPGSDEDASSPTPRSTALPIEKSESGQSHRPGPTPVQMPHLGPSGRDLPAGWQSAPEGFLAGWRAASAKNHSGDDTSELFVAEYAAESSTVAGLRRAARRASLVRTHDAAAASSKPVGIHTDSWSSDPGRAGVAHTPSKDALYCPPLPRTTTPPPLDASAPASGHARTSPSALVPERSESATTAADAHLASSERCDTLPDTLSHPLACSFAQRPKSPASVSSYLTAGRQAEKFYVEKGYLPAVIPPNENERRQALYRYGPPKIRGDPNFDRLGHLVRLVFNCRIVLISLVGASQQIFQTAVGGGGEFTQDSLQRIAGSRHCSFCAHAILQPSDEPLIVLDATKDWRFMGNPLVIGPPHIRFYAGAPLRTADGLNLGSLCVIDTEPRTEFTPRQRHTLKEFGRVVMRELELTRDRIHLTLRDRMQRSIELFTRDCLEMESDSAEGDEGKDGHGGLSVIYTYAAKAMHEALQVSGSIVFDLSHFELIETPGGADGTRGDGGTPSHGSGSKIFFPSPISAPDVTPYANFDNPSAVETINNSTGIRDESLKDKTAPPMAVLGSSESEAPPSQRDKPVPLAHHIKVAEFLRKHRTGHFYPIVPGVFRHMLPPGATGLLLVPIFGLNKQPFALLCAYGQPSLQGPTLEDIKDSALQYIRSMGTIILGAVLKKDIMLADQAKSHFISNISHELRTPLHGILASAELLAETKLNATQGSYLETVEACGKSLLELVNHVLDFTKLSGGARTKGNAMHALTACDLVKLIQEVCESSWIGQMARKLESQQSAGIGSAYASGSGEASSTATGIRKMHSGDVETVIDVSMRHAGWLVNCDAGGIRRVLMNLIGNSLKFTTSGFVHVSLREVQTTHSHVVVELSVTDTGRGISRSFLEEQLFHPFTQENHLGPGTGLGLSIVNSIVQSPSINGKIDVWSTLGEGTEMRITCEMGLAPPDEIEGPVYQPSLNLKQARTVSLLGFDNTRGQLDLKQVLRNYFEGWWHFAPSRDGSDGYDGDIVLINENIDLLDELRKKRKPLPPVILLTSARGDSETAETCEKYHAAGGIARLLFKPAGPSKLESVVDFCLQCLDRIEKGEPPESDQTAPSTPLPSPMPSPAANLDTERSNSYFTIRPPSAAPTSEASKWRDLGRDGENDGLRAVRPPLLPLTHDSHHISPGPPDTAASGSLIRRHSTEDEIVRNRIRESSGVKERSKAEPQGPRIESPNRVTAPKPPVRPLLPARSITFHAEPRLNKHVTLSPQLAREAINAGGIDYFTSKALQEDSHTPSQGTDAKTPTKPTSPGAVVPIDGSDGLVLRSALGSVRGARTAGRRIRVLGVDDNEINIKVLSAFLSKLDADFTPATNGQEAVDLFESSAPFDVIILDLSMPVLDGFQATAAIREKEAERAQATPRGGAAGGNKIASRVKVLCLTGRSSEEDKRKAFSVGADGFITRPLSLRVLSSVLRLLTQS